MNVRSHVVSGALVGGLVLGGGGAVIAVSASSSSSHSAAQSEYCRPGTTGADCTGGNGNGNGNGGGGNGGHANPCRGPHPRNTSATPLICVRKIPKLACYDGKFKLRVRVFYAPKARKVRVYLDGQRIKKTKHKRFKVRLDATNMKPGIHRVRITVRGADGKLYKKRIRFRRC